jgi:hypothetical protein
VPYLNFDPNMFAPQPPPVPYGPDEEERLARAKQALPAITVPPNMMPPPGSASVPPITVAPPSAPSPTLPTVAQDRITRPAPQPQLRDELTATQRPPDAAPDERAIKNLATERPTPPAVANQQLRDQITETPVLPQSTATERPGAPVAPTAATPTAAVRRMPLSVSDQVGPMPDRNAERYQPVGRLRSGFQNLRYAPSQPLSGGTPGFMAGEALGGLAGKFLGGVISPRGAAENKYQRDLQLWQAKQEAASKVATEEAQRAHVLAEATHRDPYTGEVDPYYAASIAQKTAAGNAATVRANALMMNAQTALGRLNETERRDLFNALAKGALKPDAQLQQKLQSMGFEYVGPTAKGQLGMLHHRGVDAYGRPVDSYYTWDKSTGFVKPMIDATGTGTPPEGVPVLPANPFTSESGTPQGGGVTTRPGAAPAPGQPFALQGPPAKGAGPYGDFVSPEQALGRLAGHRANWESTFRAWQREQNEDKALQQQERDHAAQAPDEFSPSRASWEAKKRQLADERKQKQNQIDKYEDQLSKIEAEVHSKYDELGGGNFLKWRTGEHAGWEHDPKALQPSEYPIGGEQTKKTGKLPPGYKPLRPNLLNPNAPPQQ